MARGAIVWLPALAAALVVACASAEPAARCPDGGCEDAGTGQTGGKAIGEACGGAEECAGGVCLTLPGGGRCSQPCGACPDGWSCVRSKALGEDVCVPLGPGLCGACDDSTDCSVVGSDLCLPRVEGVELCARDCSDLGCPEGYTCEQVTLDEASYSQCLPVSGSCGCNAGSAGQLEACTIMTPFGTCNGQRLCQGSTGWGACAPLSEVDAADGDFADDNCDGVDGELATSILVAPDGLDDAACGETFASPCATVGRAIARAVELGRGAVLLRAGTYTGVVTLADGVSLIGGYDESWVRGPHIEPGHQVRLVGARDTTTGEYVAILARDLPSPTRLADLVVVGPDAVGAIGLVGRSSYGIVAARAAALSLERVAIEAGDGAPGMTGVSGANAPTVEGGAALNGKVGGAADEFSTLCNASSRGAGGQPGANASCGGTAGGAGGDGGTMDASCPSSFAAQPGLNGISAAQAVTNGAGGGGGGGGASIAIFAADSTLSATGCIVTRGRGGNGGAGGVGGRGQSAGLGGPGGPGDGDSDPGGVGGIGGHGGHGGGGGGGAGGDTIAVLRSGGSIEHDCAATGGVGGSGGAGGASAPSAPLAERDGNPGGGGSSGRVLLALP